MINLNIKSLLYYYNRCTSRNLTYMITHMYNINIKIIFIDLFCVKERNNIYILFPTIINN